MILCLGTTPAIQRSMRFSRLAINDVNRTAEVSQYASGKSINAARVLRALGHDVFCTGFVGCGNGPFLLDDLKALGIDHHFVQVAPATRMCITLIDRSTGTATELIEESRPVPTQSYDELLIKFNEKLATANAVLLSGSLPPGAPLDFYANCVASASKLGKPVVLDATGEPLRKALPQKPFVIKPNRQELSQTVGLPVQTDEQIKTAIRQLLHLGPRWAVITNGSRETVASDGKRFWKVSTPNVEVISPIGSGDSFAAGLTSGLSTGISVPDACKLAAACGAANAMTDRAGHVVTDEVHGLLSTITAAEF